MQKFRTLEGVQTHTHTHTHTHTQVVLKKLNINKKQIDRDTITAPKM